MSLDRNAYQRAANREANNKEDGNDSKSPGIFSKSKKKVTKRPFSIKLSSEIAERLITLHMQQGIAITTIIEDSLSNSFDAENIVADKKLVRKYDQEKENAATARKAQKNKSE